MKILLVANGNLKACGARYYSPAAKIFNGLIRNGHNALWLSDRDIARYRAPFGIRSLGVNALNQHFLKTCQNFKPDMVLLHHADLIQTETLAEARRSLPALKIAQFNVDVIFREHNTKMLQSKLGVVDATFITTAGAGLKKFSNKHGFVSYIPNAVDASIDWPKCHENSDQEHDIFWAMRGHRDSYEGDFRRDVPLFIEQSGEVSIDYHGMNGKPEILDARYYDKIANCKMGLNLNTIRDDGKNEDAGAEDLYLYSSDRISHYMGSGLLTFIRRGGNLEEMFAEDKEAVYFSTKEEALEKAVKYKKDDKARRKIATSGWKKSHQHLNERLVAEYIVESTFNPAHNGKYIWPTEKY